jgi:hypothetical protein
MIRKRVVLPLLLLPSVALAADVSGTWHIQGPIAPNCTIQQTGNSLSGACRGTGAEGPLAGSVDGNTVRWTFTRTNFNTGQKIAPVEFNGTLNGQVLSGTITLGGANPRPFTARLLPNAVPIRLDAAAPQAPAQTPPQAPSQPASTSAAQTAAAAGVNTSPPRTVFDIDLDGSAIHLQSGLVCPAATQGWARNSTIQYDKPGFDVSCGYRSPGGSEITIYVSRRSPTTLNQAFENAKHIIPKARPNTNPRDGTADAPRGFDWLKAGFEMQEGELWSDVFFAPLADWTFEVRVTYKPADLPAVNAVFADLAARVARTAGRQLTACEAAAKPERAGKRITDEDEIRAYSVSAAAQALAVMAAGRAKENWCPEGNTSGGSTTSDYWRIAKVDPKAPALDRLMGVDNDTRLVVASDSGATATAAKNGTPHQVYDVLLERKDDVILVGLYDGRPAPGDLVQLLAMPRLGIYASVNKANSNITFFKPS